MKAQNSTWVEQMNIVKEGLSASIHATHPIDLPPFTFMLNHKPSYIYDDFLQLKEIGFTAWELISAIYESGWDHLKAGTNGKSFGTKIAMQFEKPITHQAPTHSTEKRISKVPPPIPPWPSAAILAKSKYTKPEKTFTQATKASIKNILKIREAFSILPTQKILEIYSTAFKPIAPKPYSSKMNMTTKGPSRKHIWFWCQKTIVIQLQSADAHINIINRQLLNAKSDISIDCICPSWDDITLTTNKVAKASDLIVIEKYLKNLENIYSDNNLVPYLSQSKSFLKILGVPYFSNNSSNPISATQVKEILSHNVMFNDITLAACPRVIRASPRSDMAIIWINIWNSQSSTKTKSVINRCINVGQHITTIRGTNMNPGVPQYRNCWKWGHTTFAYRVHRVRCPKYSGPYKFEHYYDMAWCCRADPKANPPLAGDKAKETMFPLIQMYKLQRRIPSRQPHPTSITLYMPTLSEK